MASANGLAGPPPRLVRLPKAPPPFGGSIAYAGPPAKRRKVEAAAEKAGDEGIVGSKGKTAAGSEGEADEDGEETIKRAEDEASDAAEADSPWRSKDFLTGQPFTLHHLTPLHALPAPGSPAANASCRDLRAYLLRRLTDEAQDPLGLGGERVEEFEAAEVEIGKVDLSEGDATPEEKLEAVGWEITFAGSVKTARFVLLPPSTATPTYGLPSGMTYFPLLLASAPSTKIQGQFLDWLEGRHDVKVSRADAGTSGGWRVGESRLWQIAQEVVDTCSSSSPPSKDLGFVFSLPPPISAKISTISLTFSPTDALQLALASRRSASAPASQFQTFLVSKLAAFWNIDLSKVQLVKLSIGEVVLNDRAGSASAGGGEATVRFAKGAATEAGEGAGSGEMKRVLDVLRVAADAPR